MRGGSKEGISKTAKSPASVDFRDFRSTSTHLAILTPPFILTPMYLGVVEVLYILEVVDKKKLFLFGIIGAGVNVALFAYTAIIGIQDTAFIASLSQTMPVERMTSKPLEMLIHLLAYLGMAAVMIVQAKKKEKE